MKLMTFSTVLINNQNCLLSNSLVAILKRPNYEQRSIQNKSNSRVGNMLAFIPSILTLKEYHGNFNSLILSRKEPFSAFDPWTITISARVLGIICIWKTVRVRSAMLC